MPLGIGILVFIIVLEIVTNKETTRCRKIMIKGREFILRKSRIKITKAGIIHSDGR